VDAREGSFHPPNCTKMVQGGALSERAVSYPASALTCLRVQPKMPRATPGV
jgi:hypothetical protein